MWEACVWVGGSRGCYDASAGIGSGGDAPTKPLPHKAPTPHSAAAAGRRARLVRVGQHALHAAVRLDQRGRALLADARDAGQVVAAVAHQRPQLQPLPRADAVLFVQILGREVHGGAPGAVGG